MATDNVSLVRRYIEEVWNKGNFSLLAEMVADNYVEHEPIVGEIRGVNALRDMVQTFRTAFPDLRLAIEDIGTAGDRVFLRWTARGTHRGVFLGIAPTNTRGELRGISIDRIAVGKIVEDQKVYDTLRLMQLLGVVAPLESLIKVRPQVVERRPQA